MLPSGSPSDENVRAVQQPIVAVPQCSAGYPPLQLHDQPTGANTLVIPAEAVDGTASGAFTVDDHPLAQNWNILRAPETSVSSPTSPFATYRVNFRRTGSYSLWVRARGLSNGQNSIYVPTNFGQNPSTILDVPGTNQWSWTKAGTYNVPSTGNQTFKIGHRERNTEIDTLVFVLGDPSNPDVELDAHAGYLEAENAALSGVETQSMTSASGGQRVSALQDVGDSLTFGAVPAGRIHIRYYLNSDSTYGGLGRQASVYLKGANNVWEDVATAHFPVTGSNSTWDTTFVYLKQAGQIRFRIDADDYTANQGDFSASFDYISFVDGGFACKASSSNSLTAALAATVPGQPPSWNTVVLPNSDCTTPNGWYDDLAIVVGKSGSADRPFTLRAETAGRVHLTGDSSIEVPGDYVVVDGLAFSGGAEEFTKQEMIAIRGDHNRLTNTTIIGHNHEDAGSTEWVYVTGHHNRIDHNHFEDKAYEGQYLRGDRGDGATDIVIDHNYFGPRPHSSNDTSDWEAITLGQGDDPHVGHHVLKYNLFEDASGAKEEEVVSIKNSGAYIYYNTFKNNRGHLTLRKGDQMHVEGNVFRDQLGPDRLGIRVYGVNQTIINNYFDRVETGIRVLAVRSDPNKSCYTPVVNLIVAYNTFAATSPALLFEKHDSDVCPTGDIKEADNVVVLNNHVGDEAANWPVVPFVIADANPDVYWGTTNYAALDSPQDGWQVFEVNMVRPLSDSLLRGAGPATASNNGKKGYPKLPEIKYDVDGDARGNPARVGADEPSSDVVIAPQDSSQVGPSSGGLPCSD